MFVLWQPGVEGGANTRETNRGRDRWGDIYANMPVKKMIALYDYDPQELSPNVDAEVSCVLMVCVLLMLSEFYLIIKKSIFLRYV